MDVVGLIALITCLSSVAAKMFFNIRLRSLERLQARESTAHQIAKNELHQVLQKSKLLEAEVKHLEARRSTTQRSIKNIEKTLKELSTRKQEDDAVRAYQEALIKSTKSK